MQPTSDQTPLEPVQFDFAAYPADTLFLDRRTLPPLPNKDVAEPVPPADVARPRRERPERRRRVDPTTFEKQYTADELEFMNAVQDFKVRSGKMFPSHGDILRVALTLGYRKVIAIEDLPDATPEEPVAAVGPQADG